MIEELDQKYAEHGKFDLLPGNHIDVAVRQANVPNRKGIYLIFGEPGCVGIPIYIGKAGTISHSGWGDQGIAERLCAKHSKEKTRKLYFAEIIRDQYLDGLSFAWYSTFNSEVQVLPALAEAQAMQVFYTRHRKLPELNKSF